MKWRYPTTIGGKATKEYTQWRGLVGRCGKSVNYEDVSYSDLFSRFDDWCDWASNQKGFLNLDGNRLWAIDKDILGDRQYNEDVCVFVPAIINQTAKFLYVENGLPKNVQYDSRVGKYFGVVRIGGKAKYTSYSLDLDSVAEEASLLKLKALRELECRYSDAVDGRVFPALFGML